MFIELGLPEPSDELEDRLLLLDFFGGAERERDREPSFLFFTPSFPSAEEADEFDEDREFLFFSFLEVPFFSFDGDL